jgi:hypothetical protein
MTSRRPPLARSAIVAFALGVGLMVPFEATATRVTGIIALAVFVACGLAAIAEPEFLASDVEEDDQPP